MSTTLITFIGRTEKTNDGYRKTNYEIEGTQYPPSAFLGFKLQEHLKPEKLIIMGTQGSMWDHLFDGDIHLGTQQEDSRLNLVESVENQTVTQSQLEMLTPLLSEALQVQVELQIIPFGQTLEDQIGLLSSMAKHVEPNSNVHLDVTHGFRSLPMIALLASMYLREIRDAHIQGIWYGVYDKNMDVTPVHNIHGLLKMADWLSSMHSYKKDGDYGVFSELLGNEGKNLETAAFYERTSNPIKAKQQLTTWTSSNQYPDDPIASLFEDELKARISWHRAQRRHEYERHLACEYLNRKDYLRAAVFGLESKISELVYTQKVPDQYNERDEANKTLAKECEKYITLRNIRNALAHGVRSHDQKIDKLLGNESELVGELNRLFKKLGIKV
jgi:CRISPR-associated Csx2 family protein